MLVFWSLLSLLLFCLFFFELKKLDCCEAVGVVVVEMDAVDAKSDINSANWSSNWSNQLVSEPTGVDFCIVGVV